MTGRLAGKRALVTGGNSGIGLAAALAFRAEGAAVAIAGRDPASLAAAQDRLGGDALAVTCDIAHLPDLDALYDAVATRFGQLDVLFANAGISRPTPLDSVTEAQFDEIMGINLKGTFFTVQKALRLLAPGASVILNSSIAAHTGVPGFAAYGASKGAVRSLARLFSGDLVPRGIRVNSIAPGAVSTNVWTRYAPAPEAMRDAEARMLRRIPAGRLGEAEEVAAAAVFLASDESRYVVGTELVVDGGVVGVPAGAPALRA